MPGPAQEYRVRAGDEQHPLGGRRRPGDVSAVAETHVELHLERDLPLEALDDAHDVTALLTRTYGHEVGDASSTAIANELGLEDERLVAVTLAGLAYRYRRAKGPGAVLVVANQRRQAGVGVEPRHAKPVDRPRPGDQRGGAGIADESVVLDARCHVIPPVCAWRARPHFTEHAAARAPV